MSDRALPGFASLRARVLSIVILGAILPLGLIGWWLSRSAATSAEQRLQAQLDSALVGVAAAIDARWVFREADLQLLAKNDVVTRMLSRRSALDAGDSAFLSSLDNELRQTFSSVVYHDPRGAVRWTFGTTGADREQPRGKTPIEPYSEPSVTVVRPVLNSSGEKLGDVSAAVRLSALMPVDSIPHAVPGTALTVYDRSTNQPITSDPRQNPQDKWISARRPLVNVPIDVELSAPTSAYLEPFEHAARLGLLTLVIVTLLAIALSAVLATRLTRSLDQLVKGAESVARGDLTRSVEVTGGTTEIVRLAASFNAMTDSLRSTLAKLSQRESLAAVGEFAASLSHEVRNALTSVAVDVQRAAERRNDTEPEKSHELLMRALRNVRRLDSIVTGALRVARSGHTPRESVDLVGIVRTARQLAEPAMSGTTTISIDDSGIGGDTLAVLGDRIALEQLFLNVLVNAGQAISTAGLVDIALSETETSAIVAIHDNGRGINARDLARLGEPFYSARPEGTGLGVSIARRIATAHGGDLTIESTSGVGTTVTVTLPRVCSETASCPADEIAIS